MRPRSGCQRPRSRSDEKELKAILGIDAGLFKRPRATSQEGSTREKHLNQLLDKNSNPQSLSAGTIDSVTKTLTAPRAKPAGRTAVLLTWQTTYPGILRTLPAQSKELKQFLAKRGDSQGEGRPRHHHHPPGRLRRGHIPEFQSHPHFINHPAVQTAAFRQRGMRTRPVKTSYPRRSISSNSRE